MREKEGPLLGARLLVGVVGGRVWRRQGDHGVSIHWRDKDRVKDKRWITCISSSSCSISAHGAIFGSCVRGSKGAKSAAETT